LKLRGYSEEDREAVARVAAAALGGSVEYWEEEYYDPEKNPRLDPEQVYVVEEDGEVRATAAVLPMEVCLERRAVPMGGIAAVATHAAYRRRGYAGELMQAAFRGMRERNVHLSMLHPFAHSYYRRYGWELASETINYDLNPTELPTSPAQKRVRAYRDKDLPQMMALLEEEASKHPLFVRRGEGRWRQIFTREEQEAVVYEVEGCVKGYLLYKQAEGDSLPRTLVLSELVATMPEARKALISFAAAFDPAAFAVKYSVPRGEPLHPHLPNSFVDTRISSGFMLRLVSVEGALRLLACRSHVLGAPLVLEVEDDVIAENAGKYVIGGDGTIRDAEAEERVALDVRQLAQLYAGYLSTRQLAHQGKLRPNSAKALELLERFFPPSDPYVSPPDDF
jgi:predicted acetyltransferase